MRHNVHACAPSYRAHFASRLAGTLLHLCEVFDRAALVSNSALSDLSSRHLSRSPSFFARERTTSAKFHAPSKRHPCAYGKNIRPSRSRGSLRVDVNLTKVGLVFSGAPPSFFEGGGFFSNSPSNPGAQTISLACFHRASLASIRSTNDAHVFAFGSCSSATRIVGVFSTARRMRNHTGSGIARATRAGVSPKSSAISPNPPPCINKSVARSAWSTFRHRTHSNCPSRPPPPPNVDRTRPAHPPAHTLPQLPSAPPSPPSARSSALTTPARKFPSTPRAAARPSAGRSPALPPTRSPPAARGARTGSPPAQPAPFPPAIAMHSLSRS